MKRPPHVYLYAWYQPISPRAFDGAKAGFLGLHITCGVTPSGLPYSWLSCGLNRLANGETEHDGGDPPASAEGLALWNEAVRRFMGKTAPTRPRFLVMDDKGEFLEMGKRSYFLDYSRALAAGSDDLSRAECVDLIEAAANSAPYFAPAPSPVPAPKGPRP